MKKIIELICLVFVLVSCGLTEEEIKAKEEAKMKADLEYMNSQLDKIESGEIKVGMDKFTQ